MKNRTITIRAVICLALLSIQFTMPSPVNACSCMMTDSPAQAFVDFDAVFMGKVIAVSANYSPIISFLDRMLARLNLRPTFFYTYEFWGYDITFAVNKSWKGITTTRVTLHTGSGEGDCGYFFNQGNDYLVYAYNDGKGLGASICSRTTEISIASEDLIYLNTLPTLSLTQVYDYSWLYCVGIALLVTSIGVWVLIVLKRRK